jgi:predicted transcriptional regulator
MNNFLISIKPIYVHRMLSGEKSIEIRRRSVNLPDGALLWIYATLPLGCILAVAVVECIMSDKPHKIWSKYAPQIGIGEDEYATYVRNCNRISAIKIRSIDKIDPSIPLSLLKSRVKGFHPPQFMTRLNKDNPLLVYLADATHYYKTKSNHRINSDAASLAF